jgi:hypothetical protein
MGYRSHVTAVMAMPNKHFFASQMYKMRLQAKEEWDWKFIGDHSVIREMSMKWDKDHWVTKRDSFVRLPESHKWFIWEFNVDNIKWYDSYPEVQLLHDILSQAESHGLTTSFYRVGEETTDVVDEFTDGDTHTLKCYMKEQGFFKDLPEDVVDEYVTQYEFKFEEIREHYSVMTSIYNSFEQEAQYKTRSAWEELNSGNLLD